MPMLYFTQWGTPGVADQNPSINAARKVMMAAPEIKGNDSMPAFR